MANAYVNVYQGNPTAGGTDGTVVSTGDASAPISFDLDAEHNESKIVTCAIRTATGYKYEDAVIADSGDTNDRFKVCLTSDGTFADSISAGTVTATNTLFYVKASSADTEPPQTDQSVKLKVTGKLKAV